MGLWLWDTAIAASGNFKKALPPRLMPAVKNAFFESKARVFPVRLFKNTTAYVRYRTVNSFIAIRVVEAESLILSHASAGDHPSFVYQRPRVPGPDGLPHVPVKVVRYRLWKMQRSRLQ